MTTADAGADLVRTSNEEFLDATIQDKFRSHAVSMSPAFDEYLAETSAEDVQQDAVFEFDRAWAWLDVYLRRRLTYDQADEFVRRVTSDLGLPNPIFVIDPDCPSSGAMFFMSDFSTAASVIRVQPRFRIKSVLLHEIAHYVQRWHCIRNAQGQSDAAHGPVFLGIHMNLLVRYWRGYRGRHLCLEELIQQADKAGLQYDLDTPIRLLPWLKQPDQKAA